jgi:hypothetical protein
METPRLGAALPPEDAYLSVFGSDAEKHAEPHA